MLDEERERVVGIVSSADGSGVAFCYILPVDGEGREAIVESLG